jgi:glycosyltransferase involved in cell wall biosynthesis
MAKPSPSTILLAVHSADSGGAQSMALAEAGYLARWFRLVIAVPDGPLRPRFAPTGELVPGSPCVPVWRASPTRWLLQIVRTVVDAIRLAWLIRRRAVRLVVTNSTVLVSPLLAARIARVPAIVHAREWPVSTGGRLVFRLHGELADTVVVISEGVESRFCGARRARVVKIRDGIPLTRRPATSPTLRVPLRLCVIGAVNTDLGKGQDVAVEALAVLAAAGVHATLDVIGPIQDRRRGRELLARADRLGLARDMRLLGRRDDVPELLQSMDILLFCSRDGADVTPLVLMEALAAERPVVASHVGSVSEVVVNGETGLLVAPGDPAALARAIEELADDPAAAREMARRGRAWVAARFDLESGLRSLRREIERELRPLAGTLS